MTMTQISCFLAAARLGSFSKAAESLYMSQPTFGRQIAAMEQELGFPLFLRGNRYNYLTKEGEAVRQGFTQVLETYERTVEAARQLSQGLTGALSIGLLSGQLLDEQLRGHLSRFQDKYPGVQVTMNRYSFHEMRQALQDGELDIGFTLTLDIAREEAISFYPVYKLRNELVLPKSDPLARRTGLTLADFSHKTFVEVEDAESSVIFGLMRKSCQEAGFAPKFLMVPDLRAQVFAVESGKGIAAFNEYHQVCNHPSLTHIPVPELPDVEFCAAWLRGTDNPAVQLFVSLLK